MNRLFIALAGHRTMPLKWDRRGWIDRGNQLFDLGHRPALDEPEEGVAKAHALGQRNLLFQGRSEQTVDISALEAKTGFQCLQFDDVKLTNIDGIYAQTDLRGLRLPRKRPPIDLARLPQLEWLVIHPNPKDQGLESLRNLKLLHLWRYRGADPAVFSTLLPKNLLELGLYWCPAERLEWQSVLHDLRYLDVARCRNLYDLGDLRRHFPRLEKLVVDACGRLTAAEGRRAIEGHPTIRHAFAGNEVLTRS